MRRAMSIVNVLSYDLYMKFGNPFEKEVTSPLPQVDLDETQKQRLKEKRENTLRDQRARRRRLLQSTVMSTALHAAATAGPMHDEQVLERVRHEQATLPSNRPRLAALEDRIRGLRNIDRRHDFLEHLREQRLALIEKARQEIQEDRFDFGEFLLETSRLDALEDEDREIDIDSARAELRRLQHRFAQVLGEQRDPQSILRAFSAATAGYKYYGTDGVLFPDGLNAFGGDCDFAGYLYPAIAWGNRLRNVAIRRYAAPQGRRFGHHAPILLVREGNRIQEIDITSGGDPYKNERGLIQGVLTTIPETVEAYAAYHRLPNALIASSSQGSGGVSEGTPRFAVTSGLSEGHFLFPPPPPQADGAFPDISPAFGHNLMRAYASDQGRIHSSRREEEPPRNLPQTAAQRLYDARASAAYVMEFLFPASALHEAPSSRRGEAPFSRSPIAENIIQAAAHNVDAIDSVLQEETVPARQVILLASSQALWRLIAQTWNKHDQTRPHEHAHAMATIRQQELERILPSITAEDIFNVCVHQSHSELMEFMPNLLIEGNRGWQLVFDILQLLEANPAIAEAREHDIRRLYPLLYRRAHEEHARLLEAKIQAKPLHKRTDIYEQFIRTDHDHLGTGRINQEFQAWREAINQALIVEHVSGDIQSLRIQEDGVARIGSPFISYSASEFDVVQNTAPQWMLFSDIEDWVDGCIARHRLDPIWRRELLAAVIERMDSLNAFLGIAHDERSRRYAMLITPLLQQSESWIEEYAHASGEKVLDANTLSTLRTSLRRIARQ